MKEEIIKYYNNLAIDYDEDRFGNSYGQFINSQEEVILNRHLDKNKTEFNLDLACGTGRFLNYADHGIDISKNMVQLSKKKYPCKNISIEDAETLSYQNSFFDNVFSFHLFMHLNNNSVIKILKEVNRVLKKGGYFIFDIPSEKRRKLTSYRTNNWHGSNQISVKKIKRLVLTDWQLVSYYGSAFLPIHRLSENVRKNIVQFDNLLCNSFIKEYSSHLIFILKKR